MSEPVNDDDVFGTPQSDSRAFGHKKLKVPEKDEETHEILRIMPPYKNLKAEGRWFRYQCIHYGHAGVNHSDPTKTKMRPFECIEVKKYHDAEPTVRCPKCDQYEERFQMKEKKKAKLTTEGASEDEIKARTADLASWLKDNNCDRKNVMLTMDRNGKLFFFTIPYKAKKALDQCMSDLKKDLTRRGVKCDSILKYVMDPDAGVWFDFKRVGKGFEIVDTVSVFTQEVDFHGRLIPEIVPAPVPAEVRALIKDKVPSLDELTLKLTSDQIQRLIDSSGDPEEVDLIIDGPRKESRSRHDHDEDDFDEPAPAPKPRAKGPESPPPPKAAPAPAPVEDDEDVALAEAEARLARAKAAKAAKTAAPRPLPPPDVEGMSDADFLKLIPNPNKP